MDPNNISDVKQHYFTVSDQTEGSKYLCFSHEQAGSFKLGVTDAEAVWKKTITDDVKAQLMRHYSLNSTDDCMVHVRSSCEDGSASLGLESEQVVFRLGPSLKQMTITLSKLSPADGKDELKELLFRMGDRLGHWPSTTGAETHHKLAKRHHLYNNEFMPKRQPISKSNFTGARKRLPGDSLINPGTRSKRPATGVAFDDEADD